MSTSFLPNLSPRYLQQTQSPQTAKRSSSLMNRHHHTKNNTHHHHTKQNLGTAFRFPQKGHENESSSRTSTSSEQQNFLSQLNLDIYKGIKSSLIIEEHHQRVKELKELINASLGVRNNNNDNGKSSSSTCSQQGGGGVSTSSVIAAQKKLLKKQQNAAAKDAETHYHNASAGSAASAKKSQAEVQSLRREQNETVARREQLKVWVNWLRTALATFASPAAAIEAFVQRTQELCVEGIDIELVVPNDFDQVVENQVVQALGRANSSTTMNSRTVSRMNSMLLSSANNNSTNVSKQDIKNFAGGSSIKMMSNLDATQKHHRQQLLNQGTSGGSNVSSSAALNNNKLTQQQQQSNYSSPKNDNAVTLTSSSRSKKKPFATSLPTSSPSQAEKKLTQINLDNSQRQLRPMILSDVDVVGGGDVDYVLAHNNNEDYDENDDSQVNDQANDNKTAKTVVTMKCEVLASLASLIALLTLGDVWSSENSATIQSTYHANQGIVSSQQNKTSFDRQKNLRLLIRSIVDDLASGIFFSPPSMGCSSPEEVVSNLGGARAFSDVFNDMLSVAVFHRDRAETCRYLEVRREAVLNRCIDNFRREHTRSSLRVWKVYTMQRTRQRKRVWQKLLRQRDNQSVKNAISVWKKFSTHVHLANMMTANKRIQQVMSEIRGDHERHRDRISALEIDKEIREKDKQDAQEKFDVVEVRNSKSRERHVAATRTYLDVRRKWVEVIKILFNDDQKVDRLSQVELSMFTATCSSSQTSASPLLPSSSPSATVPSSPSTQNNNNNNNNNNQSWSIAIKSIDWAKWILSLYRPEALQEWERETVDRTRLQRSGRFSSGRGGGDIDDRFGALPFVSLRSIKHILEILVELHKTYLNEQKLIGKNVFAKVTETSSSLPMKKSPENQQQQNESQTSVLTSTSNTIHQPKQTIANDVWNLYSELSQLMELTYNKKKQKLEGESENDQNGKVKNNSGKSSSDDDDSDDHHDHSNNHINNGPASSSSLPSSPMSLAEIQSTGSGVFASATFEDDNINNNENLASGSGVNRENSPYRYNYKENGKPWKCNMPPVSLSDLLRQDQLRLVLLVLHLAQIWTGGFVGAFFEKKKGRDIHDRHPVVYQSKLLTEPKQGKMATYEETEEMATDWSNCVAKYSSLKESTEFEAGFYEGIRECVENGESQVFRQSLKQLYDLMSLGQAITKQRCEQLLLCLRSEASRGLLDSWTSSSASSSQDEKEKDSNDFGFNNGGNNKILLPPWPSKGISSVTDLGMYITTASVLLNYQRRHLCDELSNLLLQSAEVAFAHSVFVPSEKLRNEFRSKASAVMNVFNKYAIVSRKSTAASSSSASSPKSTALFLSPNSPKTNKVGFDRSANNSSMMMNRSGGRSMGSPTTTSSTSNDEPTLVFAKKSYFKWLDDVVVKDFPDSCPMGHDAESVYQTSQSFAPERDVVIMELLICATASFVYPSPFDSLDEKVKRFCEKVL